MQLMLLEQQNKRRLLMARQEAQGTGGRKLRSQSELNPIRTQLAQRVATHKLSRDHKATQATRKTPITAVDMSPPPATKKQKRGHGAQSCMSEVDSSDVVNGSDSNAVQGGPIEVSHHCLQLQLH